MESFDAEELEMRNGTTTQHKRQGSEGEISSDEIEGMKVVPKHKKPTKKNKKKKRTHYSSSFWSAIVLFVNMLKRPFNKQQLALILVALVTALFFIAYKADLSSFFTRPDGTLTSSSSSSSSSSSTATSSKSNRFPAVNLSLLWAAPFLKPCGYGTEAIAFVQGLHASELLPFQGISIYHHGDNVVSSYLSTLPLHIQDTLLSLGAARDAVRDTIDRPLVIVCHSEPGAWHPSQFKTSRCPPTTLHPSSLTWTVGRTMFETDRLPDGWAKRINAMDETWVPSEFHKSIFIDAGVEEDKIVIIPEAVDTRFFSPLSSPSSSFVDETPLAPTRMSKKSTPIHLCSVFKWELRKGWDLLLGAYASEFSKQSMNVSLHLLTTPFNDATKSGEYWNSHPKEFWLTARSMSPNPETFPLLNLESYPTVRIVSNLPNSELPTFYRSCRALIQPSRGEGWGRPHMEAMSCEVPVIATNWSGNLAFMNDENSFLIRLETDSPLVPSNSESFPSHMWANPSLSSLRRYMRFVVNNPMISAKIGKIARKDMVENWSLHKVSEMIVEHLTTVADRIRNR